jgi:hypothetical protein
VVVEELVSLLPAALEELGLPEAPIVPVLLLPLLPALGELLVLPALGELLVLPALGDVLVLGALLLESVLELELPEVWAIARPTPPARAAAVARVVRLFFTFISVLLDSEAPQRKGPTAGIGLGRKMLAGASCFSA